jgi:hypothetical protein
MHSTDYFNSVASLAQELEVLGLLSNDPEAIAYKNMIVKTVLGSNCSHNNQVVAHILQLVEKSKELDKLNTWLHYENAQLRSRISSIRREVQKPKKMNTPTISITPILSTTPTLNLSPITPAMRTHTPSTPNISSPKPQSLKLKSLKIQPVKSKEERYALAELSSTKIIRLRTCSTPSSTASPNSAATPNSSKTPISIDQEEESAVEEKDTPLRSRERKSALM